MSWLNLPVQVLSKYPRRRIFKVAGSDYLTMKAKPHIVVVGAGAFGRVAGRLRGLFKEFF